MTPMTGLSLAVPFPLAPPGVKYVVLVGIAELVPWVWEDMEEVAELAFGTASTGKQPWNRERKVSGREEEDNMAGGGHGEK